MLQHDVARRAIFSPIHQLLTANQPNKPDAITLITLDHNCLHPRIFSPLLHTFTVLVTDSDVMFLGYEQHTVASSPALVFDLVPYDRVSQEKMNEPR